MKRLSGRQKLRKWIAYEYTLFGMVKKVYREIVSTEKLEYTHKKNE